jgi:hypothetical protein
MDIVHGARMQWGPNLASHRLGHIAHKVLFEGEEGEPDNYVLVLADESSDYYSPRHRHAWDQVRFCLEGAVPIGRDMAVAAGEVAYFPEGVPYGPQEGGPDRVELLLQFGGASGLGYLSPAQVRRAHEALSAEGAFEKGVFRRTRGEGPKNQDAYEAIWRHVTGRPIAYPKPRYKAPIVIRPGGFPWRDTGQAGVKVRALGRFPERELSLDFIALEAGARWDAEVSGALRLMFVRIGEGICQDEPYQAHSAVRLHPGEGASLRAQSETELFIITAPPLERAPPRAEALEDAAQGAAG